MTRGGGTEKSHHPSSHPSSPAGPGSWGAIEHNGSTILLPPRAAAAPRRLSHQRVPAGRLRPAAECRAIVPIAPQTETMLARRDGGAAKAAQPAAGRPRPSSHSQGAIEDNCSTIFLPQRLLARRGGCPTKGSQPAASGRLPSVEQLSQLLLKQKPSWRAETLVLPKRSSRPFPFLPPQGAIEDNCSTILLPPTAAGTPRRKVDCPPQAGTCNSEGRYASPELDRAW